MAETTQSKAGFTPGPWLAGKPSSIVGWPVVAPHAGGRLVCNLNYAAKSRIDPPAPGDAAFNRESEANAQLIAAAPDLLEALDGMIGAYWRGSEDSDDKHAPSAVKAALAAIAKALGQ